VAVANGARVTYLVDGEGRTPHYLPDGSVLFPDYALRGRHRRDPLEAWWWRGLSPRERTMVCPADYFGQSEAHRCGPCKKCLT
jgi:hypothetical protein